MSRAELLYLSRAEVEAVGPSMAEIIELVERALAERAAGRVEMPPKPGIHPRPDAFIHAMPAHLPALGAAGMKWVSGYPENQRRGLPYINGLLVLNDPETGLPTAVMDCTWITSERTAAASAVAARHLARADSSRLGILGCGVQGESHLRALGALFPLRRVLAYDPDPVAAERFAARAAEHPRLEIELVAEPRHAVEGCDLVVTAGPILRIPHATIRAGWLAPGAFAAPVDFDSYWHPDALAEVDKFCTDDREQLETYRSRGFFASIPPIWADLAELVAGRRPGRQSDTERTMACHLGLALEDLAVAPEVLRRARERGLGTPLPL